MVVLNLPLLVVLWPHVIHEKPDFFHPAALTESSNMVFHSKVSFRKEYVLLLLSKKPLSSFFQNFFSKYSFWILNCSKLPRLCSK